MGISGCPESPARRMTGQEPLYALARGNQLAEVQNVATNLTRLFLQVEKPRRLCVSRIY